MAAATSLSRKRRILVWTLVVLATVLALVSILTTWVNRQMLDNTAWKKATTQVIEDPQVQSAIGNFTVNQLYENVNVTAALQQRLPPRLQSLAPTISGALEQPAARGVALLLQRPRVQQVFINASAAAHQRLVNVLENKTGYGISTGNGDVTLNLHELVVELGTQLGLSSSTLAKLPAKVGTVTLMKSSQLSAAQTGVQAIHVLSVWLLVAVLALYGVAIYLARGRRRATLRNAGFGLAIVGLLVLVIRNLLGNYLTDALASPGYEPATHRLYLIGTSILGQVGQATLLYGAIAAVGAILAGPSDACDLAAPEYRPHHERAAGNRLGSRRLPLPARHPLGRHARPPHLVGHPPARLPAGARRRSPATADTGGVPAEEGRRARRLPRQPTTPGPTSPRPPSPRRGRVWRCTQRPSRSSRAISCGGSCSSPARCGRSSVSIVFRFDYTTVAAMSVLLGTVCMAAALFEAFAAASSHGWWRATHVGVAILFAAIGATAYVHPENTFKALASLFAFFLLIRGVLDITGALLARPAELWWAGLVSGVLQILLAFWAAGDFAHKAFLLVVWVGASALAHGILQLVTAFRIRPHTAG